MVKPPSLDLPRLDAINALLGEICEKSARPARRFVRSRARSRAVSSVSITNKPLALRHVAKSRLRLDEDAYRAILPSCSGIESARDLDANGFAVVMCRFEELGFQSDASKRAYGVRPID